MLWVDVSQEENNSARFRAAIVAVELVFKQTGSCFNTMMSFLRDNLHGK